MTRIPFSRVLLPIETGLPAKLYTSHSFRIGQASDLSFRGVSNDTIKNLAGEDLMRSMDIFPMILTTLTICYDSLLFYKTLTDIWMLRVSLIKNLEEMANFRQVQSWAAKQKSILAGVQWNAQA